MIKDIFLTYDYHSLFRSFFCLTISISSLSVSLLNWDNLISNPLSYNWLSKQINTIMFCYMVLDLVYFFNKKIFRYELIFHHFLCVLIFFYYSDYISLTFCSTCEIISGFNWIGILYPQFDWITKYYRLFSILFLRIWIWLFIINLFKNNDLFIKISSLVLIFIILDLYWLFIIYKNYVKYSGFINNTIKTNIIKNKNIIKSKIINKLEKLNS